MSQTLRSNATAGEKAFYSLLHKLPRKEFNVYIEPRIENRMGQTSKPDFVVVSALLGVLVIEVKDWKKIVYANQREVEVQKADGSTEFYPNPVITAEHYAYDLKERFSSRSELWKKRGQRTVLAFPWQIMVGLYNVSEDIIRKYESKGIWPHGVVIGRETLQSVELLEKAIRELPWKFKPEKPLTKDMRDIIREILDPSLRVEDEIGNPIGTVTPNQQGLINEIPNILKLKQQVSTNDDKIPLPEHVANSLSNQEVRLVRGVAGSGKTLVLIRRAQMLVDNPSQPNVLVVTFNRHLSEYLQRKIDRSTPRLKIVNFHSLCREILKPIWPVGLDVVDVLDWLRQNASHELDALNLSANFVATEFEWRKEVGLFDNDAYLRADRRGRGYRLDQNKRMILNDLFQRYEAFKKEAEKRGEPWFDWSDVPILIRDKFGREHKYAQKYHAVLIDEAQDFAPSWMYVIKTTLKPGGNLFMCDDPTQSIVRQYTWSQKGVGVTGRTIHLSVPFRATREVSEAAYSLINSDDIIRLTEDRSQLDLFSYELESGYKPDLVRCQTEDDERKFIQKMVNNLLQQNYRVDEIAVLAPFKRDAEYLAVNLPYGCYVQHFEKMKGLEFPVVFVSRLNQAFRFAHADDPDAIAEARRKVFTAMTRTRQHLVLTYTGELPQPLMPIEKYVNHAMFPQSDQDWDEWRD